MVLQRTDFEKHKRSAPQHTPTERPKAHAAKVGWTEEHLSLPTLYSRKEGSAGFQPTKAAVLCFCESCRQHHHPHCHSSSGFFDSSLDLRLEPTGRKQNYEEVASPMAACMQEEGAGLTLDVDGTGNWTNGGFEVEETHFTDA